MIIFDENLADILDDGNARRGWFMELRRREADEYYHIEQQIVMATCEQLGRHAGEHYRDLLLEELLA